MYSVNGQRRDLRRGRIDQELGGRLVGAFAVGRILDRETARTDAQYVRVRL